VQHARRLFEGMRDPEVHRFVPHEPPRSVADVEAVFRRFLAGPQSRWYNWIVVLKASGEAIGSVQITKRPDGVALLGYWLLRPWWRRGFAKEACAAVLDWLRADPEARTAAAEIDTRNAASIALVESLGFRRVAVTKDADFFKGSTSDEARYELALNEPSS
jgi:ribosomal-protein-alanine N-acetyltransferase